MCKLWAGTNGPGRGTAGSRLMAVLLLAYTDCERFKLARVSGGDLVYRERVPLYNGSE